MFTDSPYSYLLRRSYLGEDEVLGDGDAIECFIGEAEFIGMAGEAEFIGIPGEAEFIACVAGVP